MDRQASYLHRDMNAEQHGPIEDLSLPNITNKEICTNNKSQWTQKAHRVNVTLNVNNHRTRRTGTKEDFSNKEEGDRVVAAYAPVSAKNGRKSAVAVTKTQITLRYISRSITLTTLNYLCGAQQKRISQIA